MSEHAVLRVLAEHWPEIVAAVSPNAVEPIRARAWALASPSPDLSERDRAEICDQIEELLIVELAEDHPARVALRRLDSLLYSHGGQVDPELDLEAALNARLIAEADDPNELLREVEQRLLAEPALSAEDVRSAEVDPDQPNLIRLTRPDGTVVLPRFQFDLMVQPHPIVLAVNETLKADGDPWGVASWWLGRHSWLDAKPADLLDQDQDAKLLTAARAERED
ncbi:hypothetical protein [Flindersiella endophytica]